MRYLYTLLFYIALPYVFVRLWWRGRRLPDYRKRLGERLGFYPFKLSTCVWVHAVSVGEVLAAIPLIKNLKSRYKDVPLLVTTMTPTGAARVKAAFGETVIHAYLPYDLPGAMTRFLDTMHPVAGIIMETELWPNLIAACHQKNIPLCLANARLSEKSAKGYARIAPLTRSMLQKLSLIAAHGAEDAARFIKLGASAKQVTVTGNIKFDLELPPQLSMRTAELRNALGLNRFIWIAASTHEGEEAIVLAAHKKLRVQHPDALLIMVPRHPERFAAVGLMCEQTCLTARRSQSQPCTPATGIYLGDTMGELLLMYGVADVAFVGGSLIPRGGHNMLEAGALEKPILTGPHLFNFAEISELFISAHALIKVQDATSLAAELLTLLEQPATRKQIGQRALQVVDANRGALARQLGLVEKLIPL